MDCVPANQRGPASRTIEDAVDVGTTEAKETANFVAFMLPMEFPVFSDDQLKRVYGRLIPLPSDPPAIGIDRSLRFRISFPATSVAPRFREVTVDSQLSRLGRKLGR